MITTMIASRRAALLGVGSLAAGAALLAGGAASADAAPAAGAATLRALSARLAGLPHRRDFKTVPMVLDSPDLWDAEALDAVIAYRSPHKQVWDNTDIASPWMNLMRNSMNAQVFSFRHPEFLAVSATHGTAHLALYDQAMWDKYRLASIAGPDFTTNTLIAAEDAPGGDAAHEDPEGLFGAAGNTIPTLQHRGAVFMGCHNAIWELTAKLQEKAVNPDHLSHEAMAAELTNHLIDGVVLTPGIVGTIPELQQTGFGYAK